MATQEVIAPSPQETGAPSPADTVFGLALGYLVSRSLHVATQLGVADLLASGPAHVDELAVATGVHGPSLRRILRTLAAHGVFAEDPDGRFRLTATAEILRSEVFRDGVLLCGDVTGDPSWWGGSVISGTPSRPGSRASRT